MDRTEQPVPNVAKKEHPPRTEFTYYAPNKRATVGAVLKGNMLSFGVAIAKRKDAWSEADAYRPKEGRIKAFGKARSSRPALVIEIKEGQDPQKVFMKHAPRVGDAKLLAVELKLLKEEELFYEAERLYNLIQYYVHKRSLGSSGR